jgi:general secretion pathway protein A
MTVLAARLGINRGADIPIPALLGLDRAIRDADSFFYVSPLVDQRLAILKNKLRRGDALIVVVGERGSGKSTIIERLIRDGEGQRHWKTCRLRLKSQHRPEIESGADAAKRIVRLSTDGRLPAAIVDDAHRLSRLELKLLLRSAGAADGNRKIRSIVLFAEPQIRERFDDMARWLPPKAVIDKIYMSPLTEKQTGDYLQHRVRVAGLLPRLPFSASQIRAIHKISRGLPGWINGEAYMLLWRMYAGKPVRKSLLSKGSLGWSWRAMLEGLISRYRN